jgi:hypothetical protein
MRLNKTENAVAVIYLVKKKACWNEMHSYSQQAEKEDEKIT